MKIIPELDKKFLPIDQYFTEYEQDALKGEHKTVVVALERSAGQVHACPITVFEEGIETERTLRVVERMIKAMLWVYGGWKITVCGSKSIYEHIKAVYAKDGARAFDNGFMGGVYEKDFTVDYVENVLDAPATKEASSPVGMHLDGCRIGFDAGGSDLKISSVVDGKSIYSEEIIWNPKTQSDPSYHFNFVRDAMAKAGSKMPRVDGIGVSSAGVYVDNKAMVASLFIKLSEEDKVKMRTIYTDAAAAVAPGAPIEVANDGDVTALAGAMELNDSNVLGIAMGTSEAGGYVDGSSCVTGWLNELAFVPVDMNPDASVDEWSGDVGCGVKYFSQDAVIRLAEVNGIVFPEGLTLAQKLKYVQDLHKEGDARTPAIYTTIGTYFGYQLGFYTRFYDIKHVLVMGRVSSGEGGKLIMKAAQEVLDTEYPEFAAKVTLHLPDESSRRVGQSVAAASLPISKK